ncbi:MAG: hypothetical protein CMJ76_14205 [Planctomycetaceae bacterium]|nr:hypothetical protein [Planctomycetaceae bacterium]
MSSSITTRQTITLDGDQASVIVLGDSAFERGIVTVTSARAGDHPAVFRFLQNIFRLPTSTDYAAQLEDPLYEPRDRVVAKLGNQIIGHARVQMRDIQFGDVQLPVGFLCEMATAPEFRKQGIGTVLLDQAEQLMIEQGAMMGILRTPTVSFYQKQGWVVGGQHNYSITSPRSILSLLRQTVLEQEPETTNPLDEPQQPLNVRIWRHVEQEALMRLYKRNLNGRYGAIVRTDASWRWLLNRHSFEQVYVAIDGPKKLTIESGFNAIVGYAIVKHGRILELMTDDSRDDIVPDLLERICSDVIEQKDVPVRLDAPDGDLLHDLMKNTGGEFLRRTVVGGEVILSKVFNPLTLLKQVRHLLNNRAQAANVKLPASLGLVLDGKAYTLTLTPRSAKVTRGKSGKSFITLSKSVFSQLLLGVYSADDAIHANELEASTNVAEQLAKTIFRQLPGHIPPLDDLLA